MLTKLAQGWPVLAFLFVQYLDGHLTYLGVTRFGLWIEGNPLVAFVMWGWGPLLGLSWLKGSVMLVGIILHLMGCRRVLITLVMFYVVTAISPWVWILYL
jgi:hypothetical protein